MALSLQDKLALALTSAGSQRNLAALVGVTHQQIGRWLREGKTDFDGVKRGVKKIPTKYTEAIHQAFKIHAAVSREQAAIDQIPFNNNAPAYLHRVALRTGKPGDRVIADHTQFLRVETRNKIIQGAQDSGKYALTSIRSVVHLHPYFIDRAREEKIRTGRTVNTNKLAKDIMHSWLEREERDRGRHIDPRKPFAIYTSRTAISPHMAPKGTKYAVRELNDKLAQKHEPAIDDEKGTVLADQVLFQLLPKDFTPYVPTPQEKARRRGRRNRR